MADFRAYPSVAAYLTDHAAYLAGAPNGDKLRYAGIVGCRDYRRAFQILKDGGYATSLNYVDKLCAVVEKWNLTRYDCVTPVGQSEIYWLSAADVMTELEADAIKKQLEKAWPGLHLLKRRGIVTRRY